MPESIAAELLPLLRNEFADRNMREESGTGNLVVFPAIHPEVGDIEIYTDSEEVTLVLGKFTHVHISNDEETISATDRHRAIAQETVAFLAGIFSEEIELYGRHFLGGGTRYRDGSSRGALSKLFFGRKTYVWSGPTDDDD
ncbi:MAG: hypothetical protein AAF417_19515 [Pseudomonadota bacterium]